MKYRKGEARTRNGKCWSKKFWFDYIYYSHFLTSSGDEKRIQTLNQNAIGRIYVDGRILLNWF
jgi:hypothetical protein